MFMRISKLSTGVTLGLLLLLCFAGPALADSFSDLSGLGAGPSSYAILGLGGASLQTVDLSLVTVNGNIGIGAGGAIDNMGPSVINGNVFESALGQYSGAGALHGTITTNPSLLLSNVTAAKTAAADAASATSNLQTFASITGAQTITGVSGLNVIDVAGNIALNNANLTFTGPPDATFIINVGGTISLVGTASLLTSGVSDSNVLYNIESGGTSLAPTSVMWRMESFWMPLAAT
jgi:hypothetical protein